MSQLTLGQAARLVGVGKTTLTRAINSGRLSATRRADGSYLIDPTELTRVYSVKPETPSQSAPTMQHAISTMTPDMTARLVMLEAEVGGLKALLDEVKQARNDWKDQAARLALLGPVADPSRSWRPRRRRV